MGGLRQEVKHLTDQLLRRPEQEGETNNDNEMFLLRERELEQARDVIRSLNSQNSELRSKLEVLSSNTRECSETRSNTSEEINHEEMADTSFSESSSSESFEELSGDKTSVPAAPSSDSFVNVKHLGCIEETVISTSGETIEVCFSPGFYLVTLSQIFHLSRTRLQLAPFNIWKTDSSRRWSRLPSYLWTRNN